MPILELDGVTKRFGRLVVADGMSLSIDAGDTVGIVGPNGAGKSTLFAMIAGEVRPDAGSIRFDGIDIGRFRPNRRARAGLGRTFQIPRPFEEMTVFENVLVCAQEGGARTGAPARDAALDVLTETSLLPLANTPAGRLTLLHRKRLELARAWATNPRVILLDEVAGGLTDPEVDELVEVVKKISAAGIAVVWIEHVVRALTSTVDRLICVAGGRIVAQGDPEAVLADPEVRSLYLGIDKEDD